MLSPLRNRAGRRLREPFGKAGLTVAVIALVFAMLGGAYAAGALSGKQKKEVEKIAKKYAGKPGAPGAAGANGTNGAPGEKGAGGGTGSEGKQGAQGAPGAPGAPGQFEFTALPPESSEFGAWYMPAATPSGGKTAISFPIPLSVAPSPANSKLILAGGTTVAAGTGDTEAGNLIKNVSTTSGTFTKNATITGAGIPAGTTIAKVISASELELSQSATAAATGVSLKAGAPEECDDGVAPAATPQNPEADSGYLCVFIGGGGEFGNPGGAVIGGIIIAPGQPLAFGASTTGAVIVLATQSGEEEVWGTFAVTG